MRRVVPQRPWPRPLYQGQNVILPGMLRAGTHGIQARLPSPRCGRAVRLAYTKLCSMRLMNSFRLFIVQGTEEFSHPGRSRPRSGFSGEKVCLAWMMCWKACSAVRMLFLRRYEDDGQYSRLGVAIATPLTTRSMSIYTGFERLRISCAGEILRLLRRVCPPGVF